MIIRWHVPDNIKKPAPSKPGSTIAATACRDTPLSCTLTGPTDEPIADKEIETDHYIRQQATGVISYIH